jgi:hypothetical protein
MREFKVSEGRHMHAVAYVPPESRLREGLTDHISDNLEMYVGKDRALCFLHAKPIDRTPGYVVDYICKTMKRGLVNPDDILILPKALSELRDISQLSEIRPFPEKTTR